MAYRYTYEVRHEGLGKYRVISGTDRRIVKAKAEAQSFEWERKWQQELAKRSEKQAQLEDKRSAEKERERKNEEAAKARHELEEKLGDAEERTKEALRAIEAARTILKPALKTRCVIDWEKFKKHARFSKPEPTPPVYLEYQREPQNDDLKYKPVFSLFAKLNKKRMEQTTQAAQLT